MSSSLELSKTKKFLTSNFLLESKHDSQRLWSEIVFDLYRLIPIWIS